MKVKAGGRTYKPSTPFVIMGNVTSLVNMIDELWNQRSTVPELWLKGDQHNIIQLVLMFLLISVF